MREWGALSMFAVRPGVAPQTQSALECRGCVLVERGVPSCGPFGFLPGGGVTAGRWRPSEGHSAAWVAATLPVPSSP